MGEGAAVGAEAVGIAADVLPAGEAPGTSGVAHSPQNRSPGSLAAPHDGQTEASGAAHAEQNFRPALFSVPQLEQTNRPSPNGKGRGYPIHDAPTTWPRGDPCTRAGFREAC